jgi:glycerol-3-phosphate dehydrogenase subunit B
MSGFDVIVVGGGIAGFVAARAARAAGRRVAIVTRAGGASSSWSGAVDVADDLVDATPGEHLAAFHRGGPIDGAIDRLVARHPRHPFARGRRASATLVDDACAAVVAAAPTLGFVRRADGRNHVVATALGTVKRTALVPAVQHLDLADLGTGDVVGVVDWHDLAGFGAGPATALLRYLAGLGPPAARPAFTPVPVPRFAPGIFRDAREMARALDDDATRVRALGALREALRALPVTPTHLLTPAVLGTRPLDGAALAAIDDVVGVPLRELIATPPAVPAARLQAALRAQAAVDGINVLDGVVGSPVVTDGRLRQIDVTDSAGTTTLRPGALVLATGRFFAGGLVRDQVAREALFGLPVVADGRVVADAFIGDLVAEHVDGDHAIFRAGLAIDERFRPLDARGAPVADNVFAAGHIIGGYDPARDGGALGVAAWTARQAGEAAGAQGR